MPTDDDKKWIADQIAASEERTGARMEKVETALLTDFRRWLDEGPVASADFMQDIEKLPAQDREQ